MKTTALLVLALMLAACTAIPAAPGGASEALPSASASGSVGSSGGAVPPAAPSAPPTAAPSVTGPANPDAPVSTVPPSGADGPAGDGARLVAPKPGRLNLHVAHVESIAPTVAGRQVAVRLTWWSGIEPCAVLDSVAVTRAGSRIGLAVREGSDPGGVACIDIAVQKATIVDLGTLEPGTYVLSALGEAAPVTITVR